jgi:hypothetical protein
VLDHRAFSKGTIPCRSRHVKIHQVVENDIRMRVYQALALNPNSFVGIRSALAILQIQRIHTLTP